MNLRDYLSKIDKSHKLKSIEGDELNIFLNWLFQRHQEQDVGEEFISNIDSVIETVEYSVLSLHWEDLYRTTGYKSDKDNIITEILDYCKFEIEDTYYTQFMALDEYYDIAGMTDEECTAFLEAEYTSIVSFDKVEAREMYIKIFKERAMNYVVYNDCILLDNYFYGDEYILKIKKDDKTETLKKICWSIDTDVNEDKEYIFFIHNEDFEGYDIQRYYAATLVNELYEHNLLEIVDKNIIRVDEYNNLLNEKLFDRFINEIVETREVIF